MQSRGHDTFQVAFTRQKFHGDDRSVFTTSLLQVPVNYPQTSSRYYLQHPQPSSGAITTKTSLHLQSILS